jgi:hypothetical protein
VSAIKNDGSYTWNVPADLEAGTGPTGYGIQLIDDITGQYQCTFLCASSMRQY